MKSETRAESDRVKRRKRGDGLKEQNSLPESTL